MDESPKQTIPKERRKKLKMVDIREGKFRRTERK